MKLIAMTSRSHTLSISTRMGLVRDRLGRMDEECLALPCVAEDVLYIDNLGKKMDRLEADTFLSKQPMALGIWWFWHGFDNQMEKRGQASFVAVTYGETFASVDLMRTEMESETAERKGKGLLHKILIAPHILKVTNDIDRVLYLFYSAP